MYDLEKAIEIYQEKKLEHPNYDTLLVDEWREEMPNDFARKMYQEKYGCHIVTDKEYQDGIKYIKNNKGEKIDLWDVSDVKKVASGMINIDDEAFYLYDLALWANVKKADMYGIESDPVIIIKYAIAELKDKDFPFYPPDERPYKWVEAHTLNS